MMEQKQKKSQKTVKENIVIKRVREKENNK